jgi:predicted metal-dependent hydrolase
MTRLPPDQLELPLNFRQQQSTGRAHLALEGKLVSYTIKRSLRRRAISILIDEQGLRIGAPWDATQGSIERLLRKHTSWVLRKLDQWTVQRTHTPRWRDGESVMLLGQPFSLKLIPDAARIGIQGSTLVVASSGDSEQAVASAVHQWLHEQALLCFEERVAHYCRLISVKIAPKVFLSNARSRWGSCHTSGRIRLNWRLIQMPAHLVDYVVAHEVAHLVEMNHSDRFWRVVGEVMPDYAARRKQLRREGHRYLVV